MLRAWRRRTPELTNLTAGEAVVLFPTIARLEQGGGAWLAPVHGDVYSPGGPIGLTKRILLGWLKHTLQAGEEALAGPVFRDRITRFLASDRKGRRIAVRLADQLHALPKLSKANGHFFGVVRIPRELAEASAALDPSGARRIAATVCDAAGSPVGRPAEIELLPPTGLSVITDIDDTLKHSGVGCRKTLLTNTFLREFELVSGMGEYLSAYAAGGAAVHYVSSSPWQLYTQLADLFAKAGFPRGSFHLRAFRLRDHLLRRLLAFRKPGKAVVILEMLKNYPQRKFVLVGDSSEADPEIYGLAARKYPRQVRRILIRMVPAGNNSAERFASAFAGVKSCEIRLFSQPHELPAAVCGST